MLPHSTAVFAALAASHPDVPGIHFGIGCDHLLESMHAAGPRVLGLDWRTSITDARRRMGADLVVQGNLDPALVLAGIETALAGTDAVLADNLDADGRAHPGHIFNLGHGVQPDTDPAVLQAVVDHVKDRTAAMTEARTAVMLMGYGTPRTPADILPYYTDIRRGRPPHRQQLADLTARYEAIGGISPLAERTEAQRVAMQAALDDIAPGRYHVVLGMKHAAPFIEESVEELARAGLSARRRAGAGTALLGVLRRPVPRSTRDRRSDARHRRARDRELGDRARLRRVRRRRGAQHSSPRCPTRRGCCSPRTRLPERILETGRSVPVASSQQRRECVAAARRARQLGPRLAERRPHARAMVGSRHPAGHRRAGGRRSDTRQCSSAQSDSSPIISRCCTTSTSRRAGERPRQRPRVRAHRAASTTTPR